MTAPYPRNAAPIMRARANGMRPAGPLLVDLTGGFERLPDDAMVYVDAGTAYRWDWARGLGNVVVLVNAKTRMGSILEDLQDADVGQIDVVDVERKMGWLVLFARPLKTARWPPELAADWLANADWHRSIERARAEFHKQATAKKNEAHR